MKISDYKDFWDKLWIGLIFGVFLPILFQPAIVAIQIARMGRSRGFVNTWEMYLENPGARPIFITLCVLINILPFSIAYKLKWDLLARGVMGATFVYAAVILALSF